MNNLPPELIQEIAIHLPLDDITNFMSTNRRILESLRANIMWIRLYRKYFDGHTNFEKNLFDWQFLFKKYHIYKNWKDGRFETKEVKRTRKILALCINGDDIVTLVDDSSFKIEVYDETLKVIQTHIIGTIESIVFNLFCINNFIFIATSLKIVVLTKNQVKHFKSIEMNHHFSHWFCNELYLIASSDSDDKLLVYDMFKKEHLIKYINGTAFGMIKHLCFVKKDTLKCYDLKTFEVKFEIEIEHQSYPIVHEKYLTIPSKNKISLYDSWNGNLVRKIKCEGNGILSASTSGKYFYSNFFRNAIHVFDENGEEKSTFNIDAAFHSLSFVHDHFIIKRVRVPPTGYQPTISHIELNEALKKGLKTIYKIQSYEKVDFFVNEDKSKIVFSAMNDQRFVLHVLNFKI